MTKVSEIQGIITLTDGTTSQFSISRDLGWQQWGAVTDRLGSTVDVLEALVAGLTDNEIDVESSDDEDDVDFGDRCEHGKLLGTGECWACVQDDRAGEQVRRERAATAAEMTQSEPDPAGCEFVYEAWGPDEGCREFMDEPDTWTCTDPATHRVLFETPPAAGYPSAETILLCDEHAEQIWDDIDVTVIEDTPTTETEES